METFEAINKTGSKENAANNFFGATKNSLPFIQPKLTINQPNDVYEQEAEAMADKVMRMEQPGLQLKHLPVAGVQRKCAHCEEEEKQMQRKETNGQNTTADSNLENYVGDLNSGGQPLSQDVRNFYEPRFGYDFSNVKVHTDTVAAKSAQSINALAYTSGSNIVFNNGQYSPDTNSGKRLLGHELTHVIQQGKGVLAKKIQRKMGDGHDLNSISLSGEERLESIYDEDHNSYLRYGTSGPAVARVQEALVSLGYELQQYGVDGILGSETSNAIKDFQSDNELDVDGIVGVYTITALDDSLSTCTPVEDENAATESSVDDMPGIMLKGNGKKKKSPQKCALPKKAPKKKCISIKTIVVEFTKAIADAGGRVIPRGNATATFDCGEKFTVPVSGGSTAKSFGMTDEVSPKLIFRKEGATYKNGKGQSMPFALFYNGGEAVHIGRLDLSSHGCVHVDDKKKMTRMNSASVENSTSVEVKYDSKVKAKVKANKL